MNRQFKKIGAFVGLAILSASISVGLAGCPQTQPGNNGAKTKIVKIDANLPLTGNLAVYGTAVKDGATLAIEDLQKSDPDAPKLEFNWQDNAGAPPTTVSILQKQLLTPPDIYISGVKPQTMAIKDQLDAKGIPHFVWIFDSFINQKSTNNFRTWVNYRIEAPMYLKYVDAKQPKKVAILYVNLPHTEEAFRKFVIPKLKEKNIEIFTEAYEFGTKDYKDIAAKVKNFNPDLIIINGYQNTIVGIVRSLSPLGLISDGNTIVTYDMLDAAKVLGAKEIDGIRAVVPRFVIDSNEKKVAEWNKKFKVKFGRDPLYTDAYSYDMVSIIHDTSKRLNLPATSSKWIEALKSTNIEGITGSLSFDKNGDLVTPLAIAVFRNGKPIFDENVN